MLVKVMLNLILLTIKEKELLKTFDIVTGLD